jgi:hypothetical protein
MTTTCIRRIAVSGLVAWMASFSIAAQLPPTGGAGQSPLEPIPGQSLSSLPPAGSSTATAATEITIRWSLRVGASAPSPGSGANQTDNQFDVVSTRSVGPLFVRERDPQLAVDEIVIIAVGADGQSLGWQHVKDPRFIRAESAGPDGVLSGQTLSRSVAEMVVSLPSDITASQLRFYQPRWTGQAFVLDPLGTAALNPR